MFFLNVREEIKYFYYFLCDSIEALITKYIKVGMTQNTCRLVVMRSGIFKSRALKDSVSD